VTLVDLIPARRGHFRLESGHHGELWLDLDALFLRPRRLAPHAAQLARRLRPHATEAVCGPLVGGAFVAQLVAAELDAEAVHTERGPDPGGDALLARSYALPPALRERVCGRRIAVVDDVINAGSATRATLAALTAAGARPVALGALLVLGDGAQRLAAEQALPLESVEALPAPLWTPANCPRCVAGEPLEDLTG